MSTWVVRWRPCRFVVPVIVLQAPLFECYLDDNGAMKLVPAEMLSLYWDNPLVSNRSHTVIDVVTVDGLPRYIESVKQAFSHLKDRHEAAIVNICTASPAEDEDS